MHEESDRFGSRRPIELISQTNPILIIDEPQSVDGAKTLESMQEFKPLFSLRYFCNAQGRLQQSLPPGCAGCLQREAGQEYPGEGRQFERQHTTEGYLYLEEISLSTTKPPFAVDGCLSSGMELASNLSRKPRARCQPLRTLRRDARLQKRVHPRN